MRDIVVKIIGDINDEIFAHEECDLLELGIIDSFDILNIVVELECQFNIEIPAELIIPNNFRRIDNIVMMLEEIVS